VGRKGDGLYLRGKTWWLDFVHQGRRHHARLGKSISRTAAREIASVRRAEILKGEAGIGRKKKDATFEKALEEFVRWANVNKRVNTVKSYRQCLVHLQRSFAGRRLSEIHPFLVEKHKRVRVESGAPVAANRELTVLKLLFNRCRDWGLFEGENPARTVKRVKEPKGRLRYLQHEEEDRLLATAREPLRTIILCGIYAGLRVKSEALTLQKADIDLRRGLLTVQASYAKSGVTRTVPLNSVLRKALAVTIERSRGAWVFAKRDGRPYRSIRSGFDLACRRAKLDNVTPHTLRHTSASRLAMAGVDSRTIQELGGWKELKMVERYAHLSPTHKAAAVERIARGKFHDAIHDTAEIGGAEAAQLVNDKYATLQLVPKGGLEPPHPCGHMTLNHARLPIPPLRPVSRVFMIRTR
jgi:integrase